MSSAGGSTKLEHASGAPANQSGARAGGRAAARITSSGYWKNRSRTGTVPGLRKNLVLEVLLDRRLNARLPLNLPVRVLTAADQREDFPQLGETLDISPTGSLLLLSSEVKEGATLELELCLVDRPLGRTTVWISATGHVVRVEPVEGESGHSVAVNFDRIRFGGSSPLTSGGAKPIHKTPQAEALNSNGDSDSGGKG